MGTHWKIDNYVIILRKMYRKTFSNTSGNVLKIETIKNGAKFPQMYSNRNGSPS